MAEFGGGKREAGDQLEPSALRAIWSLSAHSTSFCANASVWKLSHNSLLSLNLFNLSNIFFQRQAETLSLLPLLSLSLFLVDKANLLRWYINTQCFLMLLLIVIL